MNALTVCACLLATLLLSGVHAQYAGDLPAFPSGSPWQEDISSASLDSESTSTTQWLEDSGGWGLGRLQIDYSIEVLEADCDTPMVTYVNKPDWFEGECDSVDAVPMPGW
jgi:hypothetical protein